MPKPKVFVTRAIHQDALDTIAQDAEMEVWPDEHPPSPGTLREKVAAVEGVLTNIMDRVDTAFMDAAPRLKVVSQVAVGVDNIDVAEVTRRGIPVGNTPGVLAPATADIAFALLMAAARRVTESERWLRSGKWEIAFHPLYWLGADVSGATIGIIGMGKIGLEMAKRARGFEMRILYHSRNRNTEQEQLYGMEYRDFYPLLREADFVTLHVPLTPETRHLIGEAELAAMKPTAILVNAARGPVVDPRALYKALKAAEIRGAALDVTDPEPIPEDDPLLTLENLVVTPHIGSASEGARRAMCMLAATNLIAGVKGERLVQCVNPEVYGGS